MNINVKSETRILIETPGCGYYEIIIEGETIRIRKSGFLTDQIAIYPTHSNVIDII